MNKSELIDAVASATELSRADATRATDAVLDSIISTLTKGDQATLVGFGTFSVRDRAARAGRWSVAAVGLLIACASLLAMSCTGLYGWLRRS